jgi:hypothetical protein
MTKAVRASAYASTTFTSHLFLCQYCNQVCRATQEAIDMDRRNNDWALATDAEIGASFGVCLACVDGVEHAGEKTGVSIVIRSQGTLYDGRVLLVRMANGRVHETDKDFSTVVGRIEAKACIHCGRSMAHHADYEAGDLCVRCDVDTEGGCDIGDVEVDRG